MIKMVAPARCFKASQSAMGARSTSQDASHPIFGGGGEGAPDLALPTAADAMRGGCRAVAPAPVWTPGRGQGTTAGAATD
jgi:hypothetical protein